MAAPLDALSRNLFGFDGPEASGERFYHRLIETYVVLVSAVFAWRWAALAARLDGVVVPTGLAHNLQVTWLQGPTMPYVWAALLTLLLGIGFVNVWRGAYLTALAGMHLLHAAHEVLGKVSHASHLVSLALLGFGLAAVLFPARPDRGRFALGFTFFMLGFTYGLAALSKLVGSGPAWADGSHLWMWIQEKHVDGIAKLGAHRFNALQRMVLGSRGLATAVLAFGWLVEATAWLVWFRRFRLPVLLLIAAMHVGILFSMGIAFHEAAGLCLLLALGPFFGRFAARRAVPIAPHYQEPMPEETSADAGGDAAGS